MICFICTIHEARPVIHYDQNGVKAREVVEEVLRAIQDEGFKMSVCYNAPTGKSTVPAASILLSFRCPYRALTDGTTS